MNGKNNILNKLSIDDVKKLKVLLSIDAASTQKEVITLRVFCDEYKEFIRKNRSENYYDSVVIALKHLTNYFGLQKPLSAILFKDVELFVTDLMQKVNKGYRVYYRTLKAAFNKAVDWNYVDENYFTKIKLPKRNKLNPAFISEAELKRILEQDNPDVVKDVIVFAFYTGMRLGEIVCLKWKNIDLENRMIVVGDEEFVTKARAQRRVPVCGEGVKVLEGRSQKAVVRSQKSVVSRQNEKQRQEKIDLPSVSSQARFSVVSLHRNDVDSLKNTPLYPLSRGEENRNGFVFGKVNGMAYTGDYFSKRFKRACMSAGISDSIHFHSLRHSFASNLAQKGVSLYVIKELLGHSSISTTEIYAHLNVDTLREAVSMLDVKGEKTKDERVIGSHSLSLNSKAHNTVGGERKLRLVVNNSENKFL
jgi:site-specific recombinase XerD